MDFLDLQQWVRCQDVSAFLSVQPPCWQISQSKYNVVEISESDFKCAFEIHKADHRISRLYKTIYNREVKLVVGHSRLVTNGISDNQPVYDDDVLNDTDLVRLSRPSLGTGLYQGGVITPGILGYRVNVSSGTGAIVNTYDQLHRQVDTLNFTGSTEFSIGTGAEPLTFYTIMIDGAGNTVSINGGPSYEQGVDNIILIYYSYSGNDELFI